MENSNKDNKVELINSKEFDDAILEGAELKKDIQTSCKTANKSSYAQFYEAMLSARPEIQKILDTKKKKRDDAQCKMLQEFKTLTRQMYCQTQSFIAEEKVEEGKKTKAEKLVGKLFPLVQMLKLLGNTSLEDEFAKKGIKLEVVSLEDEFPMMSSKKESVKSILLDAKSIKQRALDGDKKIVEDIYASKIPAGLQFDKESNNAGLKQSDFKKLVDMKTKLEIAKTKEAKEKVDEKIQHVAEEKQFEIARAELVRDKLSNMK